MQLVTPDLTAPSPGRQVFFRRSGNFLYIQGEDGEPLPDALRTDLTVALSYEHRRALYGYEARDLDTGRRRHMEVTTKQLFRVSDRGDVIGVQFGMAARCAAIVQRHGCVVEFWDDSAPRVRPGCYEPVWENVLDRFDFRPMQAECLASIAASDNGVVHASVGFGKMVMLVMICLLFPQAKIHIATRRSPLVIKIANKLRQYLPNIGQVGAGRREHGDRITVFTFDSLHHSDFDADFLLVDEAHEAGAERYSNLLSCYQTSRNFAFTATPYGRKDGADIRLEAMFGPTIFHLPYWEAVRLGLTAPVEVLWESVRGRDLVAGVEDPVERMRRGIWYNSSRNDQIAAGVRTFVPPDEQYMVLVDTIHHGAELYRRLCNKRERPLALIYDSVDEGRYAELLSSGAIPEGTPKMTPGRKAKYHEAFENGDIDVVATTTWEVGIDPIHLQHLFLANACTGEIRTTQGPGRASRISTGKSVAYVRDYRDEWNRAFNHRSASRASVYASLRWDQRAVNPSVLPGD